MTNAEVVEYVTRGDPVWAVAWFVLARESFAATWSVTLFTWSPPVVVAAGLTIPSGDVIPLMSGTEGQCRDVASKVARILEQEWRS